MVFQWCFHGGLMGIYMNLANCWKSHNFVDLVESRAHNKLHFMSDFPLPRFITKGYLEFLWENTGNTYGKIWEHDDCVGDWSAENRDLIEIQWECTHKYMYILDIRYFNLWQL